MNKTQMILWLGEHFYGWYDAVEYCSNPQNVDKYIRKVIGHAGWRYMEVGDGKF